MKKLYPHRYLSPKIDSAAWVAPGAQVMGDVWVGAGSSVWFNTVVRGDVNYVRIGERSNIQDLSMIHVAYRGNPTLVGNDVTVGHGVILHACTVGNFALIGMGTIVMDEVEIGDYVLVGAGSLVTRKTKIPSGSKVFGRPAKVVGELTEDDFEKIRFSAQHYQRLAATYSNLSYPPPATPVV